MIAGDMEDPDPGGHGGPGGVSAQAGADVVLVDAGRLANYILRLASILLDSGESATPENGEMQILKQALSEDKTNLETQQKFISDPQVRSLLVERTLSGKEDDSQMDTAASGPVSASSGIGSATSSLAPTGSVTYTLSTQVQYSSMRRLGVALVKRGAVLEAEKPLASQLRVLTLGEGSPYETLHTYVAAAVAPYFKSFVRESGKADRDGDKMASSMEKKIAELEMGLLHLQQNIDIPEITLTPHPVVAQVSQISLS
jgi:dynein heavy chain 1